MRDRCAFCGGKLFHPWLVRAGKDLFCNPKCRRELLNSEGRAGEKFVEETKEEIRKVIGIVSQNMYRKKLWP